MPHYSFDAIIFDLDGVITQTALVHSRAWKKMFDEYLSLHAQRTGQPFREFQHEADYLPYVDGKPRYDGVKSFLESRGITLPFGQPSDPGDAESICGLGNRKNDAFNDVLKAEGVKVYESTVSLIKELREHGVRVGVASSSKNCEAVLQAAGLMPLIETRVDGVVSAEMGLKGKPGPDIFVTAASNLGAEPYRCVVVEDAVSGVAAGRNGNFGFVLGIAREENHRELYAAGADLVVSDMSEITLDDIDNWFLNGMGEDAWSISYKTYEPEKERTREALLTIGNGYMGTRGAFEEQKAGKSHYPGTYIAGMYNRLTTVIAGRDIENEDFVNCPNWLPVTFRIEDGDWIDLDHCEILDFDRSIDLRNGLMYRRVEIRDRQGNETLIVSQRFASMDNPHLAALRYSIIPLNYSGKITLRSGIDGNIINEGVERYKSLNQQHLKPVEQGGDGDIHYVVTETTRSGIQIAEAFRFETAENYTADDLEFSSVYNPGEAYCETGIFLSEGSVFSMDKIVSVYTSKPDDAVDPLRDAVNDLKDCGGFDELLEKSTAAWKEIWDEIDIRVTGDRSSQKLLRLHLYHLIVSMGPHNAAIDASITARGLHGEAYRGHIFWDELFILPLYNMHLPETAKAMLMYRYNRLAEAKKYAARYGYKGAMFPWQSGSDGREETQVIHLNPLSGNWDPDHSSLQRHVSLAIAYNVWQYFNMTDDVEFMQACGAEMFFEICRFWASKCEAGQNGRYNVKKVMGPDEFHEQYPGSDEGGLKDNAYTNLMVAWMFRKASVIRDMIGDDAFGRLGGRMGIRIHEISDWIEVSGKLNLCIDPEGIIAQYDGYFDLKELDWDLYRQKYKNIYRLDRILKAENLSPDEFKVAKQADMLMTFYNLDKEEVDGLLAGMGYTLPADYLQRNLEYYLQRTSHGSTLSRVVHAKLGLMAGDFDLSWKLYSEALASDLNDIQGGTTGEGIHAGVMAGTVLIALTVYAGINLNGEVLRIDPILPPVWKEIEFGITFKGVRYRFVLTSGSIRIMAGADAKVMVKGQEVALEAGMERVIA